MSFALLIVGARIYVRSIMLKTVGADDYVIMAAMLCSIGVLVCFIGETHHGIGMHSVAIPVSELGKLLHWQFYHSLIVMFGISLIKISIACFLLRLVTGKVYKIFLYGMTVFLTLFTLACAGTLIFACIPVRASWDLALAPTAKCYSKQTFTNIGLFNSIVNIVTDVTFAVLPVPIVWNLQINRRTRTSLIAILSLGFFACACAIVKTILQARFYSTPDYSFHDSYFVWNSIELNIGIIAACLPALRPLFAAILETSRAIATRRTGMSSSGGAGTRHKYYMHEDGGIGMASLEANGRSKVSKYDTSVTVTSGAGRSNEDFEKTDAESEEGILPIQKQNIGVVRTVRVSVA